MVLDDMSDPKIELWEALGRPRASQKGQQAPKHPPKSPQKVPKGVQEPLQNDFCAMFLQNEQHVDLPVNFNINRMSEQ